MSKLKKLPKNIVILGIKHKIEYCDKPSDVSFHKRDALLGEIDFWTHTIRVYIKDRGVDEIWQTLFHEIIHATVDILHLKPQSENDVDLMATAFLDMLVRNGLMEIE